MDRQMRQRKSNQMWCRRLLGVLSLAVCLAALPWMSALALAAVPVKQAPPPQAAKSYTLSPQEQLAVNLLNQARQNEGLEPLKVNLQL